jgi:hypothetical protein
LTCKNQSAFFFFSSEVAKGLKRESYGFIFGFNTFLALLFQSILTLCVTDGVGLALDPQTQASIKRDWVFLLSLDINVRFYDSSRYMVDFLACWGRFFRLWRRIVSSSIDREYVFRRQFALDMFHAILPQGTTVQTRRCKI